MQFSLPAHAVSIIEFNWWGTLIWEARGGTSTSNARVARMVDACAGSAERQFSLPAHAVTMIEFNW